MKKNYYFLSGFLLFTAVTAHSQIMHSNGALIQINNGAIVNANGGVTIANNSNVTNNGSLTVTKNSTLPQNGNFTLNSSSIVSGDGLYKIEQDWINDATFNAGNSQVELYGNTQQFITSTTAVATTFNQLVLSGTGSAANRKKTLLNVNASVSSTGSLNINDRELETQINTFFILNPSASSVSNSTTPGNEGFVSSTAPGTFSRVTNTSSTYLFPTGSSAGTLRYRPVELTPVSSGPDTYVARLNNNDANSDGFNRSSNDGSMCLINSLFYHSIDRTAGTSAADINMFYISSSDGNWSALGHWKNTSANWNDMNTVTSSTSGAFSTLKRSNWLFADPGHPYALTNPRPQQPAIQCPTICENSTGNSFTLTGSSSNYQWSVPAGASIASGQGTDAISVNWTSGAGYVHVYAVSSPGCFSLPDSCMPSVLPAPVAQFSTSTSGNFADNYTFVNQSSGGSSWDWNFGDGSNASGQTVTHSYAGAGTYTVMLTVSNGGCSDTATVVISTTEGINIPNIFSPNGDGLNDNFYITSSNLKEYTLSIYNRWGELMFKSEDPNEKWDGTYNGKACPNGTYFFLLNAKSVTKDYSTSGYLALTGSR